MVIVSGSHIQFPYSHSQDKVSGEITFYMKGADTVMANIVQYSDWLEEEVQYLNNYCLINILIPNPPPPSLSLSLSLLLHTLSLSQSVVTWQGKVSELWLLERKCSVKSSMLHLRYGYVCIEQGN